MLFTIRFSLERWPDLSVVIFPIRPFEVTIYNNVLTSPDTYWRLIYPLHITIRHPWTLVYRCWCFPVPNQGMTGTLFLPILGHFSSMQLARSVPLCSASRQVVSAEVSRMPIMLIIVKFAVRVSWAQYATMAFGTACKAYFLIVQSPSYPRVITTEDTGMI